MKVCVVGSGGREHALAEALSVSNNVVVDPGNPGMDGFECISAPPERVEADLWVIGPEAPLVDGLADRIRARGGLVFGPGPTARSSRPQKFGRKSCSSRRESRPRATKSSTRPGRPSSTFEPQPVPGP